MILILVARWQRSLPLPRSFAFVIDHVVAAAHSSSFQRMTASWTIFRHCILSSTDLNKLSPDSWVLTAQSTSWCYHANAPLVFLFDFDLMLYPRKKALFSLIIACSRLVAVGYVYNIPSVLWRCWLTKGNFKFAPAEYSTSDLWSIPWRDPVLIKFSLLK